MHTTGLVLIFLSYVICGILLLSSLNNGTLWSSAAWPRLLVLAVIISTIGERFSDTEKETTASGTDSVQKCSDTVSETCSWPVKSLEDSIKN